MVYEKVKKVLYIDIIKDIYSMLQSSLLSYIELWKYFETDCFKIDPYDPCVTKNIIKGEPLTVVFHVDYLKASHNEKNMVDNFEQWIYFMYLYLKIIKVKSVRGEVHEYISIHLDYTKKEK